MFKIFLFNYYPFSTNVVDFPNFQEETDQIHPEDRDFIKLTIVDLMLKSPPSVQKQLSTAIAIIGKEDFPAKWPNLINDMVNNNNNFLINNFI